MGIEGRGPGGKVGPPPCAQGPGPAEEARPVEPEPITYFCDLCGAPMLDRHCKLVCRACGYQRDCSDP